MTYELPALPYSLKSLEPFISEKTLFFHHTKHHATYVNNYNKLINNTVYANKALETVIKETANGNSNLFNNSAQAWNHTFFWNCLKQNGGGKPTGELQLKIESDFGSFEKFIEIFKTTATEQFGNGWVWLVLDKGLLKVTKTTNSDTPLAHNQAALFTVDLWEHAYYLDYQNRRLDFVSTILENLINWDFVTRNLTTNSN
ncbi:MAG: superoxide dismutase [Rhodospirillaceae bacterium]|jgi:Fe-Mn family superoxide dismutase|nr:superoxide dismutase [Rhodospirillaceae bacterium]